MRKYELNTNQSVQIYRGPLERDNALVVANFPPLSLRQRRGGAGGGEGGGGERRAYKSAVIDDGVSINATASIDCYAHSFVNILQ